MRRTLIILFLSLSAFGGDYTLNGVIDRLEVIESNGNTKAIGDNGRAVGCLQIWRIMVKECNRLVKRNEFNDDDRFSRSRSRQMATIFLSHQRTRYFKKFGKYPSELVLASSWNTGSIFKQNTKYKNKYKAVK